MDSREGSPGDVPGSEALRTDLATVDRICHELRRPLGAIDAFAELLADEICGPVTAEQGEALATIQRSVQLLEHSITDLFETLAPTGARAPRLRWCDLDTLVASFARAKREVTRAAGLRLHTRPENPVFVRTDPTLLRDALDRLLENAQRHACDGAELHLHLEPSRLGARLRLQDRGPGIDPAELECIFQPFRRSTLRDPGRGLGVGLTIARATIESLGGSLRAENRRGGGAEFIIELPRRGDADEPPPAGGTR